MWPYVVCSPITLWPCLHFRSPPVTPLLLHSWPPCCYLNTPDTHHLPQGLRTCSFLCLEWLPQIDTWLKFFPKKAPTQVMTSLIILLSSAYCPALLFSLLALFSSRVYIMCYLFFSLPPIFILPNNLKTSSKKTGSFIFHLHLLTQILLKWINGHSTKLCF